jgi:D-glycero-D-manno-heptose 1,7-bisphosphate phosphatase
MTAGLFLDRDGVINHDPGYTHRIDDFQFIDGVFDTVALARSLGFVPIVVTNQAGIARGLYGEAEFLALTEWMLAQFAAHGAAITSVYHCPFHPDGLGAYRRDSDRRKPAPGMILDGLRDHRLEASRSLIVGDRPTDIAAGKAAGLGATVLFAADATGDSNATVAVADHGALQDWLRRWAG